MTDANEKAEESTPPPPPEPPETRLVYDSVGDGDPSNNEKLQDE